MRENGGFTLIELLVVITIIGILVGFSAINLVGIRQRGRDAQRKADLKAIQSALELYRADNRSYPTQAQLNVGCGNAFIDGSGRTYLTKMPCDPSNSSYNYFDSARYITTGSPPQSYTLIACLENQNDADSDTKKGLPENSTACSGPPVSYTVSNP